MKNKIPLWLVMSFSSLLLNGVWGALIEIPEKRISPSFPTTLGYIVWSITFIPVALTAIWQANWKLEYSLSKIMKGLVVGILGAGGQFLLFAALKHGPAYIIFPVISVYPVLTVLLAFFFLKEKTNFIAFTGIILSVFAIGFLSMQDKSNSASHKSLLWLGLAISAFVMWGSQSFFIKAFLKTMAIESIIFYMMVSNLIFIPFAYYQTDFSLPVGWHTGLYLTIGIQLLNSVGAVLGGYAVKYGKVMIVTPLCAMAPFITIILSLILYARMPYYLNLIGMILSVISIFLLAYGEIINDILKQKE